ncbi:GGDEF domain-containing protein [Pseudonocardia sp. DSM 110487]|uniref:GGDEF domain-containing protein n=1 Tax=Pseudonocardia sp. DSM 110487 TaxID=2865833 RepID=UPI00272D71DC|nr:GGDEF domain-containing protein [Pseudonocardia sp. DSM 110487]
MSTTVTVGALLLGSVTTFGWVLSEHARQRLRRLLHTDRLTGLPNRDALTRRFQWAIRRQRGGAVGVLLLDLDNFKQVNDTHGHAVGDLVLQHVADRLAAAVEPVGALPVRLHGDEFAVLLTGLPVDGGLDQASSLAGRVADAIRTPLDCADQEVTPSASAGAAVTPRTSMSPTLAHPATGSRTSSGAPELTPAARKLIQQLQTARRQLGAEYDRIVAATSAGADPRPDRAHAGRAREVQQCWQQLAALGFTPQQVARCINQRRL